MTTSNISESRAPAATLLGHNHASQIEYLAPEKLAIDPSDAREFSPRDIKRAGRVLRHFGARLPALIGKGGAVIAGQLTILAARSLGLPYIPVLRAEDLSSLEQRALSHGLSKIGELGRWKLERQRELILEIEAGLPDFDLECLALDMGEIDLILDAGTVEPEEPESEIPSGPAVSKRGDIFVLGRHRFLCGDATSEEDHAALMADASAKAIFTDPPYGCRIAGFASTKPRREFVQGSGDMTPDELRAFAADYCEAMSASCSPGAVVYICSDWRGFEGVVGAARRSLGELLNVAVWVKSRSGMGSFLRSRHELVLIFAKPGGRRRNNVELGRHGRDRSNVWEYPSAVSFRSTGEEDMLGVHATPKPVQMVADAILDSTARGDVVLDPFLGSGSTAAACERSGRVCYGMDLDPLYIDATIRRLQTLTSLTAIHAETGLPFNDLEVTAARAR